MPGLFNAYRAGNVTLANAIGTGVADDKAIYAFVPEMIRFYLGEEPMLQMCRPTWACDDDERSYILEQLDKLVVKAVERDRRLRHADRAAAPARAEREASADEDRGRAAQLHRPADAALSRAPDLRCDGPALEGAARRPAALHPVRREVTLVPGGLTRVALRRGRWW